MLATRARELERTVLASGAAVGRLVEVVPTVESLSHAWADAGSVLIGCDLASEVVEHALPRRPGVVIVGLEADRADACAWSLPLAASVVVLPEGARWLSSVITGAGSPEADPVVVVGVLGGSGGVGASTLAVGLAMSAVRAKRRVALVDVDVIGGGLDLLLGAEDLPGWRWSRLRTARGQIGDLRGKVPAIDGIDVVTMSRSGDDEVGRDAVTAVVTSLRRTHEVVVVDIGRGLGAAALESVRLSDRVIVACGQDIRSVASARMVVAASRIHGMTGAVVRHRTQAAVTAASVADALGMPLWGIVPEDRSLTYAADRGVPPSSKRWSAVCDGVLAQVVPGEGTSVGVASRSRWWRPW